MSRPARNSAFRLWRALSWPTLLRIACILLVPAACRPPPAPALEGNWYAPPASRLSFDLRELAGRPHTARFEGADGRYTEETAEWGAGNPNRARAGLRLSEASPGPPLTDPHDPPAIIAGWADLTGKRPSLSEMATAETLYGSATWWRAGIGTSVCVLFTQQLPPQGAAAATLSGYYCNPQGVPLSPQAAVAVVRSVRLRAPLQTP